MTPTCRGWVRSAVRASNLSSRWEPEWVPRCSWTAISPIWRWGIIRSAKAEPTKRNWVMPRLSARSKEMEQASARSNRDFEPHFQLRSALYRRRQQQTCQASVASQCPVGEQYRGTAGRSYALARIAHRQEKRDGSRRGEL